MFSWAQSRSSSTYICHCGPREKRHPWVFHALSKPSHCVASAGCGSPGHAAVIMLTVEKRRCFRKNGTSGNSVFGTGWLHASLSPVCCALFSSCFSTTITHVPELHQSYLWARWGLSSCSAAPGQRDMPGTYTLPASPRGSTYLDLREQTPAGMDALVLSQPIHTPEARNTPLQVLHQSPPLCRWGLTSCCRRRSHRRMQLNHCQAGWHLIVSVYLISFFVEMCNPFFIR